MQVNLEANEADGGVRAIEAEFAASGTDDDKECLQYILHGLSGSNTREWANGILDEGRPDGLSFDFFCGTPQAQTAKLSRGMVLALRLYTCAPPLASHSPATRNPRGGARGVLTCGLCADLAGRTCTRR